jgi:hypothetical protein
MAKRPGLATAIWTKSFPIRSEGSIPKTHLCARFRGNGQPELIDTKGVAPEFHKFVEVEG